MKTLCTFLITLTTSFAFAQPVMTKHLKYNIGDRFSLEYCDTNGIYPAMVTGPNQTWNVTILNKQSSATVYIIDRKETAANEKYPDTDITIDYGGTNGYDYLQKTATELRQVAFEVAGSSFFVPTPYYKLAVWPFTYNDSYKDTSAVDYPQDGVSGTIYVSDTADGYGTLILNNVTYTNVLRTHRKEESFDQNNQPIEYIEQTRWWDTVRKTAILEMKRYEFFPVASSFASVRILTKEWRVGIEDIGNRTANVSAHTQNGQLTLIGELETGKEYQLHLYNSAGQCITTQTFTANGQPYSTPVPDMPSGIYYIHLQRRGDTPGYIKFMHQQH